MEEIKNILSTKIKSILDNLSPEMSIAIVLSHPENLAHGDLTTNVAMNISSKFKVQSSKLGPPRELAQKIVDELNSDSELKSYFSKISVEGPGFINFWLDEKYLLDSLQKILSDGEEYGKSKALAGKKIMVEYAHPNTHKEMHIGHMRTLITGEAICRMLEANGAEVFRANYQGDIGLHVAKAMYGIDILMKERNLTLDEVEKWSNYDKAHFLGEGYARGSKEYESEKEKIDEINKKLYQNIDVILVSATHPGSISNDSGQSQNDNMEMLSLYKRTRQWSLDYYDEFYKRFYTKFNQLFFESEMSVEGVKIVRENIGKVFEENEGAVIFRGEQYGLHTRVFITGRGIPTYEAKDVANAYHQYKAFPFDKNIHVVASEQVGYFKVVIKALEVLDPEKFKDREYHLSMGMVHLTDRKMSSRTGDVLTVDWLIDQVKESVQALLAEGKLDAEDREKTVDAITIGAIKYSVLKVGTGQDAAFDIKTSVSLDGNSGPYLQYSYARTQSVLRKSKILNPNSQVSSLNSQFTPEESQLLRYLLQYPTVVAEAGQAYAPNTITNYLFELAQKFNLFYQKNPILNPSVIPAKAGIQGAEEWIPDPFQNAQGKQVRDDNVKEFRLALTSSVGQVLKNGLNLLGIQTVEKM